MTRRPPGLGDDHGHLVHLSLRTAECAELWALVFVERRRLGAYPLLGQLDNISIGPQYPGGTNLSGALVLAVAQQFNDSSFYLGQDMMG
jgi:hypothetical protein